MSRSWYLALFLIVCILEGIVTIHRVDRGNGRLGCCRFDVLRKFRSSRAIRESSQQIWCCLALLLVTSYYSYPILIIAINIIPFEAISVLSVPRATCCWLMIKPQKWVSPFTVYIGIFDAGGKGFGERKMKRWLGRTRGLREKDQVSNFWSQPGAQSPLW